MKVHHFGFLTDNIQKSVESFSALGFTERSRTLDESRGIEIAFIQSQSGEQIELIMPINDHSVVSKLMGKLKHTIYHTCYETESLDNTIADLRKKGFLLIDPAKPAVAIDGKRVAFLYSKHAGMIELVETGFQV